MMYYQKTCCYWCRNIFRENTFMFRSKINTLQNPLPRIKLNWKNAMHTFIQIIWKEWIISDYLKYIICQNPVSEELL